MMGYLGGGILTGDAIGAELEVGLSTLNVLVVGIIQMTINNLLGKSHGLVQSAFGILKEGEEGIFSEAMEHNRTKKQGLG